MYKIFKRLFYRFFIVCAFFLCNLALKANDSELDEAIVSTGKYSYSLTLTTAASKEFVLQLWEDFKNWKSYDTVIQYSYLEDGASFTTGATGYVKTKGAPKTKFVLTEVDIGNSFVESLSLPLWSRLDLKRRITVLDSNTVAFIHEVEFKGRFKWLMYSLLAKRFKKDLKKVMVTMKELAETSR